MEVFYPVDRAMGDGCLDNPRLPSAEVKALNSQMNCNLYCSEDAEVWFDEEEFPDHVTVIDEDEFFDRFVDHC